MEIIKVIFDFDGVILDDTVEIFNDHIRIAQEMGIAPPTHELLKKFSGKPWESKMIPGIGKNLGWTTKQQRQFITVFTEHHLKHKATPIPDIACMLETLRVNNHLLSIISSRDKSTLAIKLAELGIDRELFYLIQSHEDCPHKKPSGRAFYPLFRKMAAENIGLKKIIYVGDSIRSDYGAITNLQKTSHQRYKAVKYYLNYKKVPIHFIGVTTLHTADEFRRAGIDYTIPSLKNFSEILTRIR